MFQRHDIAYSISIHMQESIWDIKINKIAFQTGVYILYSSEIYVATG